MRKTTSMILCQVAVLVGVMAQAGYAQMQSITIPAGADIAIRTTTAIDSKDASLTTEYPVSMDDPIVVDGVTVVQTNASAWLRVAEITNPKLKAASMSIVLVGVASPAGERVNVTTETLGSKAGSSAKHALIGSAAGAAVGAAIGSVGGPVGTAVGAAGGAVAGTITGILMGKKSVVIPAETRYTFRLTQPATINYLVAAPVESQITPPPAAQPAVAAGGPDTAAPQSGGNIALGQSPAQVQSMFGQPVRSAIVGTKEIYFYKDMKVTFQDGAVSDVQ